jgi:hypothetical protein
MSLRVFLDERRSEAEIERRYRIEGGEGAEIWFRIYGDVLPPPEVDGDAALLSTLSYAMRRGLDLHIGAPVSRHLLAQLDDYQAAWSSWCPKLFSRITVTADAERLEYPTGDRRGVMAYSGGVDSTYTLLRHSRKEAGRASCELVTAMFAHGFDIPLAQREAFDSARRKAAGATAFCGVPLTVVETNFRDFVEPWRFVFGIAVAAALSHFNGLANVGVIAADTEYRGVHFPWGSNLITNPLLSCHRFEILTDGAAFTRCEKVAAIAQIPPLRDRLRVCWDGQNDTNCGECGKCRRTYLNFLATRSDPGEFLKNIDRSKLTRIKLRNVADRNFVRDIIRHARRNGIDAPWVDELDRLLLPRRKRRDAVPRVEGLIPRAKSALARAWGVRLR